MEEFATFIEGFCANETGPYELDDATSIPAKTELLRDVQSVLASVHDLYPSSKAYCSAQGFQRLLDLALHLRKGERATLNWIAEFRTEGGELGVRP
jgi:hypothetical protein